MTEDELEIYNYLQSRGGEYISLDRLLNLGYDSSTIESLFQSEVLIEKRKETDTTLAHGLRINVTDASNYVSVPSNDWLKIYGA